MRILITGGSGFIGKELTKSLLRKNHFITQLKHTALDTDFDNIVSEVEKSDAIINLAGFPIISKWNEENRKLIYDSRINTTKLIVDAIEKAKVRPKVFVSASAVGFYDGEDKYDEDHTIPNNSFLGDVCSDWETTAMEASKNTRVVIYRFGTVLGRNGGIIKKVRPIIKRSLMGIIPGSGKQYISWIHVLDVVNAVQFAMKNTKMEGVYNLVAPEATKSKKFWKALSKTLKRPCFLKIPESILKLFMGESAIMLTQGQNVVPKRLNEAGFNYIFPDLKHALQDTLKKGRKTKRGKRYKARPSE